MAKEIKPVSPFKQYLLKRLPYSQGRIMNRSYQLRDSQVAWIDALAKTMNVTKSEILRAIIDLVMDGDREDKYGNE